MKEKTKFSPHIYGDWFLLFQTLTPEQSSEVLKGIAGYPDYEVKDVPIWAFIKSQIDNEKKAFDDRCEKATIASNSRFKKDTDENQIISNDDEKHQTTSNDTERHPITRTRTITELNIKENNTTNVVFQKKVEKGCCFNNSYFFTKDVSDEFLSVYEELIKSVPSVQYIDPFQEYQKFKDYWISIPGQKGVKKDWVATWRNWLRNSKTTSQKSNNFQSKIPTKEELLRKSVEECMSVNLV